MREKVRDVIVKRKKEKLLLQGDVTSPLKFWKKHGHKPFEWVVLQNT